MEQGVQRSLVLHGSIVVMIGLLVGIPYGQAITGGMGAEVVRAWRAAHDGLIMGGIMLVAVGPACGWVRLRPAVEALLGWSLIVSGYAFVLALVGAAVLGVRGLEPAGPGANLLVFGANTTGALGSLLGIGLLVGGAIGATLSGESVQAD